MADMKEFEHALMERLTTMKLDDHDIRIYSDAIVEWQKSAIHIERIWRVGQPPIDGLYSTHGLIASSRIKASAIHETLELLARNKNIYSVEYFPVGIIKPDFYDVQVKLGNSIMERKF